jgi:DNA-binding Xre family transcriptional regulator
MPGKVYNRFKILLAEKEIRDNKKISYQEIKEVTGIAASTISAWATNNVTRYDGDTIAAFCDFLECDVADLIVYKKKSGN